jgi:GNAT superfamily N-acetyltransferase
LSPSVGDARSSLAIRVAEAHEVGDVCSILLEAAGWQREIGTAMWLPEMLGPDRVGPDVAAGLFVLARSGGEPAGTFKFQLSDPRFWPELEGDDSAFVHRLAVRRKFAGRGVSTAMLEWAEDRARSLGRSYLRLDCDARRPRLRAVYERHGFALHDETRVMGESGQIFETARYELRLEPDPSY